MAINITRPDQINGAGDVDALRIEKFNGKVATAYQKASIMEQILNVEMLTGTDTLSTDALGQPGLQVVIPGETPTVSTVKRGRTSVTVRNVILSRTAFALLDQVQDAINVRDRVPAEQGRLLARNFDRNTQVIACKAALSTTNTFGITGSDNFPGGTKVELAAAGDENDADKLLAGLEQVIVGMENKEVDVAGMQVLLPVNQYYTLLHNDKLLSVDYSTGNGDFARGRIIKAFDLPVRKCWTLPSAVDAAPLMGSDYAVDAEMATTKALVMGPDAVLAARAISLTSLVHYDKKDLVWYVDSYYAFDAAPFRPAEAGVLLSYTA